jgi:hypothetical protein
MDYKWLTSIDKIVFIKDKCGGKHLTSQFHRRLRQVSWKLKSSLGNIGIATSRTIGDGGDKKHLYLKHVWKVVLFTLLHYRNMLIICYLVTK